MARKHKHHEYHGMSTTKTYGVWADMKKRCLNTNYEYYKDYGGRGISISDEWMSFANFYNDMGDKPEGMSIDRVDNNGGYCKENCRWATTKEQGNNKRNTVYVVYNGEIISIGNLSMLIGIHVSLLYRRIIVLCWPEERWSEPINTRRMSTR